MKPLLVLTALLWLTLSSSAQENIDPGKDRCSHCNMFIRNTQFSALAIDTEKTYKFDAIECLVNFLKSKEESTFSKLLVADYSTGGRLINATSATYLKSNKIASPMGAYLSAYSSAEVAEKVKMEKGGELMNWTELKARFKNSNFGLMSHPTHHHRPDAYAPIGVMGDHLHHKNGFMVSVRYMTMDMEGNLNGSSEASNMEIFQDYMVAPQSMKMDMMMVGIMYAPSDKLTVMLMQKFVKNDMDLSNRMGMRFSTKSNGMGDLKISALYGLVNKQNTSFHFNAAINLPVADIEERHDTPMMENMKLPYSMQLGSGTTDLTIGGTYKGASNKLSWGIQQLSTLRTGENSEGYRLGNLFELNAWTAYGLTNWVSISGRLQGLNLKKIEGVDEELNPMMAPLANTMNSGFSKIRSYIGTNISLGEKAFFRDFKLGFEVGLPIFQDVEGIQMDEGRTINAGLRYSI